MGALLKNFKGVGPGHLQVSASHSRNVKKRGGVAKKIVGNQINKMGVDVMEGDVSHGLLELRPSLRKRQGLGLIRSCLCDGK